MTASAVSALVSIPALAAALRRAQDEITQDLPAERWTEPGAPLLNGAWGGLDSTRLTPMYRIAPTSPEPAAEAAAAAHVLSVVGERLRRLPAAYGEWVEFDAEAYFDLPPTQSARLLQLTERVTSVHLSVFADLLLPSFQSAIEYWEAYFQPCYLHMQQNLNQRENHRANRYVAAVDDGGGVMAPDPDRPNPDALDPAHRFFDEIQPAMIAHWQRLLTVALHTRRLLGNDAAFWALNAANDERLRRRDAWRTRPAPGMAAALLPKLTDTPTLTLSIDFPLPAFRQPGRLRRLRRGRSRRARPHNRQSNRRDTE